jgi:ribulose-phosphate 3-epimerase
MNLVVPAVIPTSYHDLLEKLTFFDQIPSHRVQIDMVDGVFAFPPSWPYTAGTDLHDRVATGTLLPRLDRVKYEADLLCKDPESIATDLLNLGIARLTVHAECTDDIVGLIARMRRLVGAEADFVAALVSIGLSINIDTDIAVLVGLAGQVEYVQFMGIDVMGKQGQPFNPKVIEKVKAFHAKCPGMIIQVDGGVSLENAKELVQAGASRLIIGSAILHATNLASTVTALEDLKNPYRT